MVTPMARSSRLILIPRPISARPLRAVKRLAFSSSSWSLASGIQAPIAATAARHVAGDLADDPGQHGAQA